MSDAGDSSNDATIYVPDQQPSVLGNAGFDPGWSVDPDQPSILGPAFNPKPWTLADSTIHGLLSPEDIATIDFGDMAQPQPRREIRVPTRPRRTNPTPADSTDWPPGSLGRMREVLS